MQSVVVMALACANKQQSNEADSETLRWMTQELKQLQFRNGTVVNFPTTALVMQVIFQFLFRWEFFSLLFFISIARLLYLMKVLLLFKNSDMEFSPDLYILKSSKSKNVLFGNLFEQICMCGIFYKTSITKIDRMTNRLLDRLLDRIL